MKFDASYDQHDALRKRIIAELNDAGLDLAPLGYVSNVDLLYIMEQTRDALSEEQKTALENAAHGLGYAKTRFAILSLDELRASLAERSVACSLGEAVEIYVQVLDPYAVVNLQHSVTTVWPLDLEMRPSPISGPGRMKELGFSKGRPVALVSDFFVRLNKLDSKRLAWLQMIPARRGAVL